MLIRVLPLVVIVLTAGAHAGLAQSPPGAKSEPASVPDVALDARLADARKGLAIAVDDLGFDRPVAGCFAERMNRITPIEPVKDRAEADVIFRISARMASDADRSFARLGANPDVELRTMSSIVAELPDGTPIWSERYFHGTDHGEDVECRVAGDLLTALRDAMRTARDSQ